LGVSEFGVRDAFLEFGVRDAFRVASDISTALGASIVLWCAPRSAAQAAGVAIRSGGGPLDP
jgi:hypothetical protein